jgi:hypothetical protein
MRAPLEARIQWRYRTKLGLPPDRRHNIDPFAKSSGTRSRHDSLADVSSPAPAWSWSLDPAAEPAIGAGEGVIWFCAGPPLPGSEDRAQKGATAAGRPSSGLEVEGCHPAFAKEWPKPSSPIGYGPEPPSGPGPCF